MEDVIAPISKELLKAELTEEKRLRMTCLLYTSLHQFRTSCQGIVLDVYQLFFKIVYLYQLQLALSLIHI